jgi:hypothetical protein
LAGHIVYSCYKYILMKNFIKLKRIQILFLVLGAIGGFIYWKFVGCESGTCFIKSVWYWSTLWGAALGYLISDFFVDIIQKKKKKSDE